MMHCLKIAICDDDAVAIGIISGALGGMLEKKAISAEICTFRAAKELEYAMRSTAFDLILLDIDLPDANGIDLGTKLRESGNKTHIIFVSGHENSVFEAFKCEPIGFVRKSRFLQDLTVYLDIFLKKREESGENAKTLSVKCKKQTLILSVENIVYIEGALKNQRIVVAGSAEEYLLTSSMKKLEEELSPYGFIRFHSGYLVNYRYIKLIKNHEVLLKTGKLLPVSRGQMHSSRERFFELMRKNGVLSIN